MLRVDPRDYWRQKHQGYASGQWAGKPNIFAKQAIKFFPAEGRLLDLGAGLCYDSRYFSAHGYDVLASDFVQPAKVPAGLNFQEIDLNSDFAFEDGTFDIVYSHLALHYFSEERTEKIFTEIARVLQSGGVFAALFNTVEDPEIKKLKQLDTDFYETSEGITKRFFSAQSLGKLTGDKFKTILLDNHGQTYKDETSSLIRYVGQK